MCDLFGFKGGRQMNEQGEITVSFGGMFAFMLRRWKLVIALTAVFMVGIGGYLTYRQSGTIENKYKDSTYNMMIQDMTEGQIQTIDLFFARYQTFQDRIRENQRYNENSILMKLDADRISVLKREYLVKTDYMGVMSSFSEGCLGLNDYEKMAAELGNDVDARYIGELVTLDGVITQNGYQIDTVTGEEKIVGTLGDSYTGILTVTIKASSQEDCNNLIPIADKAVLEHTEALKAAGVIIYINEISTNYTEKADEGIAELQRTKAEQGSTLVTEYMNFEKSARESMDIKENEVFAYLIEKEQEVTERLSWKRYLVIGFIVGCLLSVFLLALMYVFRPKIKTIDDINVVTREKSIGVVIQKKDRKFFLDKFFHNWAKKIEFFGIKKNGEDDSIAFVCDRIGNICREQGSEKVYLVSDSDCKYTKSVLSRAISLLAEMGIEAGTGDPANSLEALKELRKSELAILVVTMMDSMPKVVKEEYVVCDENKINVAANFTVCPQK